MPILSFLKQLAQRWAAHHDGSSAAAIGFYAIFMLAPMLVLATAGLGYIVGDQQAQDLAEGQLTDFMGPSGAHIAEEVLANADFSRHGVFAPAVSTALMLFAASAFFFQVRQTLDVIFGRPKRTARAAVLGALLGRVVAALSVVVAAALVVATLVAQVILNWISKQGPLAQSEYLTPLWRFAPWAISTAVLFLLVVAMLKFLPSSPPGWLHALLGAAVTVVLFELAKWLVGLYISRSVITSAYGPSSAVVAFILWVYFSAQFFILGAEICQLSVEREQKSHA